MMARDIFLSPTRGPQGQALLPGRALGASSSERSVCGLAEPGWQWLVSNLGT
jgi:hypothetical protein